MILLIRDTSSTSGSTVILDPPPTNTLNSGEPTPGSLPAVTMETPPFALSIDTDIGVRSLRSHRANIQSYMEAVLERRNARNTTPGALSVNESSDTDTNTTHNMTALDSKPKHYYKFAVLPFTSIKVHFDRLALIALLDRSGLNLFIWRITVFGRGAYVNLFSSTSAKRSSSGR